MDHEGIENAWFYQTILESTPSESLEIEEGFGSSELMGKKEMNYNRLLKC